jgi:hypothetical protein
MIRYIFAFALAMRLTLMTLAVLVAAIFAENVNADDAPKRSAELQVLERFIGTWDSVVTNKTTGEKSNTIGQRRWSRKGQFVLFEEFDSSTKKEQHFLVTYDPTGKVYRACFINENAVADFVGTWDGEKDTMTWKGSDSFGNTFVGVDRFIDKDHAEWSMVFKNPDGKVFLESSAKVTRRKK